MLYVVKNSFSADAFQYAISLTDLGNLTMFFGGLISNRRLLINDKTFDIDAGWLWFSKSNQNHASFFIIPKYHRAVRRKANLEVTGEEKPITRLRRRKASKLHREKIRCERQPIFLILAYEIM